MWNSKKGFKRVATSESSENDDQVSAFSGPSVDGEDTYRRFGCKIVVVALLAIYIGYIGGASYVCNVNSSLGACIHENMFVGFVFGDAIDGIEYDQDEDRSDVSNEVAQSPPAAQYDPYEIFTHEDEKQKEEEEAQAEQEAMEEELNSVVDESTKKQVADLMARIFGDNLLEEVPKLLHEYIEQHTQSLRHPKEDTQYLIYTCRRDSVRCGGAGNRLEGIMSTIALSIITGRTFGILWEKPFPLTNSLVPSYIDWDTARKQAEQVPEKDQITLQSLNSVHLVAVTRNHNKVIFLETNMDLISILWGKYGLRDALGMDLTVHPLTRSWFMKMLFKPSPALIELFEQKVARLGMDIGKPYIATHIRMGRVEGEESDFLDPLRHSTGDIPKFARCADTMSDLVSQAIKQGKQSSSSSSASMPQIFLASDSQTAKDLYKEEDDSVFYFTDKVLHTDKSKFSTRDLELAKIADRMTWVEMLLVAGSECAIVSQSSFSWAAINFSRRTDALRPRCWAKFDHCSREMKRTSTNSAWIIRQGCVYAETPRYDTSKVNNLL